MQGLGQADLAREAQLDDAAAAAAAGAGARALQDPELDAGGGDAEEAVQGQEGGPEGVDGHVAGAGGGGDDAGAGEAHVHVGLGEGGEEGQGQEEVGHAAGAVGRQRVLDDIVGGGAGPGHGARDQAGLVGYRGAGVRDLHGAAVGDGLEEAEEGDLMGGEARRRRRGAADARDVDGPAGEGGEDEPVGE